MEDGLHRALSVQKELSFVCVIVCVSQQLDEKEVRLLRSEKYAVDFSVQMAGGFDTVKYLK
jgi:hypothetical protein